MGVCSGDTCGAHGRCKDSRCECDSPYINKDSSPCSYSAVVKSTTFYLSMFLGAVGFPWFLTAKGSSSYVCCGVAKLFTFGGCGIWATIDCIFVVINKHMDGN